MRSEYEFERRFLVANRDVLRGLSGNIIVQGYLFSVDGYVVRVRRTHMPTSAARRELEEGPAILATKGPRVDGRREEYESEIPVPYAMELIKRAPAKVSKTRYQVVDVGQPWDVDVFHGDNDGLVIAECEGAEVTTIRIPSWCGAEITTERRFDNESLARTPYSSWPNRSSAMGVDGE